MTFKTEQEKFWAGEFGSQYIGRNQGDELLAANVAFFARAMRQAQRVGNCIEFGANIGMNLKALKVLYPGQQQFGIEINPEAAAELGGAIGREQVYQTSILDFQPERTWDLVLIKTVLIHINPDHLPEVYESLYRSTGRYLMVAEYYSQNPTQVTYRGHTERLFKRDFCGELLAAYPDLKLVDYGFAYRNDPVYPQDDISWFLMEKRN
jgi:pseudaminic acid biosynthesis-associated methylase